MIDVRVFFPDGKSADGQIRHLPHIGETLVWTDSYGVTTWCVAQVTHWASNIEIPNKPGIHLEDFSE